VKRWPILIICLHATSRNNLTQMTMVVTTLY